MDGISMKYQIDFSKKAEKVIRKWKKSNPALFKKLYDLLPELEKHPETGTGHPEPLVGCALFDDAYFVAHLPLEFGSCIVCCDLY